LDNLHQERVVQGTGTLEYREDPMESGHILP
jgi:hypothetical protein